MKFQQPLIPGKLIKRYKRFLADIELDSGEIITVYCPNTGSMKSCTTPGWKVMLSKSDNPNRKHQYTWEMVHNGKCWIGINTMLPNYIVEEAIKARQIPELSNYTEIKREVKYGKNSRIDILLQNKNDLCYIEVKNVTLVEDERIYYFPDAVTTRGRKHLFELMEMVNNGSQAVMFFLIQRNDGTVFKPAAHIDPQYAVALKNAYENGVEILAYRAEVTPEKIDIVEKINHGFSPNYKEN